MTEEELAEAKARLETSRRLAIDCLKVLPAGDLRLTGLALVQLIAIWLEAVPEEERVSAYTSWLNYLHRQLHIYEILHIMTVNETWFDDDEPNSAMLH